MPWSQLKSTGLLGANKKINFGKGSQPMGRGNNVSLKGSNNCIYILIG